MIEFVKKVLPYEFKMSLRIQKRLLQEKYTSSKISEKERYKIDKVDFLKPKPLLIAGYPKSGNTWLRFLIYNYFNITLNNAASTITYSELNETFQPDVIGINLKGRLNDLFGENKIYGTKPGYPHLIRTHEVFKKEYKVFDKVIFISRNPLDTLVSKYYFHVKKRNNVNPRKFPNNNIDSYVQYYFPIWKFHLMTYLSKDNILHITYEELQKNPADQLRKALDYLGEGKMDSEAIQKSIDFSSFGSIKKMGREKGEMYGMAPKENYTGEFTRKGKVGGYKEELSPQTINKIKNKLHRSGVNIYGEF